jgi:alpha-beta hydrolase superfamily lysophospholipase
MQALVALDSHQLACADGTLLYVCDYLLPAAAARGSIVLMHGLGEHSGRYRHLAQFFNECGLSVRCYDQRGHGRSQGARGDVINGNPIVQDAQIVIDDFAARFPRPPFLFGHSMGGLFAAHFALSGVSPLRGLILSSPALAVRLSPVQALLLKLMYALAPWLGLPNGLQPRFLSHDRTVVAAYQSDPLVHGKISARLLRSMLSSIEYCQENGPKLAVPTLIQIAGDDRLVDAEGSKHFFARLPPACAELKIYEDLYHEIFNETDAGLPLADLRVWLSAQVNSNITI